MVHDGKVNFLYSSNDRVVEDPALPPEMYAAGQALFPREDPARLLQRSRSHFIAPERAYEKTGQVNSVCFIEGLVYMHGQWLLYYGTADSKIVAAAWEPRSAAVSGGAREEHPVKWWHGRPSSRGRILVPDRPGICIDIHSAEWSGRGRTPAPD